MRVLVVDDLQVDRFLIKKQLTPHYEVTTLSSATEAMAFAVDQKFDIALLNVMLTFDMDCIELLHGLKNMNSNFLPLAITCYVDTGRFKELVRAGFFAVLRKPFDRIEFNEIVNLGLGMQYTYTSNDSLLARKIS